MKKQKNTPPRKLRTVKIFALLILIVIAAYIGVLKYESYSEIQEVKAIVQRAKELMIKVSQPETEAILYALDSMKIYLSAEGETIAILPHEKFVLTRAKLPSKASDPFHFTAFYFDDKYFRETGKVFIVMNHNVNKFAGDLDGLASGLIHEIFHAIQADKRSQDVSLRSRSRFEDEIEAWNFQGLAYLQSHPELNLVRCDCNTMRVISPDSAFYVDPMLYGIVMFGACKEKFLETVYDKNR